MKKNDMLLFGGVILLAAVTLLLYALFSKKGSCVLVLRDGVETERYLLSEDIEVEIKTEYGTNHLKIENGYASVTEADCPDKLCVHQEENLQKRRKSHLPAAQACHSGGKRRKD